MNSESKSVAAPARASLSSWRWTRRHLELFTELYLQNDVLLQPAGASAAHNNKKVTQERSAALRSLGAALEPGLEPLAYRTRSIIYMYRCLCRTELRSYIASARWRNDSLTIENILQHAPEWLRRAEEKLHMLPPLIADGFELNVTPPSRASRSSCLLALTRLVRASRGKLPINNRLQETWDRLRHMSLHKLSRLWRRECHSLWLHEWLAIDVVLLFDKFSLITEESFQVLSQMSDLERLLESVRLLRHRAGMRQDWLDARYSYCQARGYVSLVTLQRLWCELRSHTRRALRRSEAAPLTDTEPRSAAAIQFYKKVAGMFPGVLSDPAPAWHELVTSGRVHEDQYDVGEVKHIDVEECKEVLDELVERDKDDDIILIEKEIETVELNESSDEESPMVIDGDKAPGEKYSSVTEQSSIAFLKKLNTNSFLSCGQSPGVNSNSCKTVLIFEDDDDDSSDMTNQNDDLIGRDNLAELNIEQPIDDNITKDNTDIIERALKVRDALEPVAPLKTNISNTSTNRNYSDSDSLLTDGVKILNDKFISSIKENIDEVSSVSKYIETNYNETKQTSISANDRDKYNTFINETISLDSQTTPVIPDYLSIDNLVTTSDSQTKIISPKASDNNIQTTKSIKSNVIPADIAREIKMKKDIQEKNYQYKRILPKQDIAIDIQMQKHIKLLDNETKISVLQAEIANEKAKGTITNDDNTNTSPIPANDNYNIVISDVKSLVNPNKISNRSYIMTNDIKPHNSNHIIQHHTHHISQENNLITNNKDQTIDNDCDSHDSCELVKKECDSCLENDSPIEQCGSQIDQVDSRVEQTDSPIEQGSSHIGEGDSRVEQSDSQIDIKPPATLNEQMTEYVALKYFKYKRSNNSHQVPSKTIVSLDNIIPWIRPLNHVIKSELSSCVKKSGSIVRQSGSSVRQSGSSVRQGDSSVRQGDSNVRQSGSGVAISSDSAEDSSDTARSEHSFGSNDSDVEFDIDQKLLQTVSVPLVRCDYILSRSHFPNTTPLQFNLNDRHEVNDHKTPKNPLSKANDSDVDNRKSRKNAYETKVDVTGSVSESAIVYDKREKETDTYFDVALRNLSAEFIFNTSNIELLALCRPFSVVLERLSPSLGKGGNGGIGREIGGEGRRQKRVRLADIEEVRRVNRSLLTAQVAPIAADPVGGDADSVTLRVKPGPKSKKPPQPKEKEKKRKKTKPTSKSRSKIKHQNKIIPTLEEFDEILRDDLKEWKRQKTINQKYFYISSMMTDKNKTTPKDNSTPKNNATPIDNDAPIDKPKDNSTPIHNNTPKYNGSPKDNVTERASDQPQVSTSPVTVSHLFHTQSIPIHNNYFHQTTVKTCINVTNGNTDKPVGRSVGKAPSTNTLSLGIPSNDQNIDKPVVKATVKSPPPPVPLKVRSDLCAPNQPTTFLNKPSTFVNQPSTSVNQPSTFKNQPASFATQTASFVNQPTVYVYQPSTFVKHPVTFINQPVKFLHQYVTTINHTKKKLNQPTLTNQPVTPVNQLHFTSSLVPVAFKMMPPKANPQQFVNISPKPPPYEKFDPKSWEIRSTDTILEKQIYNTKDVKSKVTELNQPDSSLFHHMKLSKHKVLEHRDCTKNNTKDVKSKVTELNQPDSSLFHHMKLSKHKVLEHRDSTKKTRAKRILIQRALDDVVTSMELEPVGDETKMKMPVIESVSSQRRRASCDVIDAVAPKRRASDVINYFGSDMTIRPVDKTGPKFTLDPNKITIKPLTMTKKPHDVITMRSLEVAGSQENAKY